MARYRRISLRPSTYRSASHRTCPHCITKVGLYFLYILPKSQRILFVMSFWHTKIQFWVKLKLKKNQSEACSNQTCEFYKIWCKTSNYVIEKFADFFDLATMERAQVGDIHEYRVYCKFSLLHLTTKWQLPTGVTAFHNRS